MGPGRGVAGHGFLQRDGNRDPLQDWNTAFTPNAAQLSNSPMALEPTCHLAVGDTDLRRYCERKPLSAAK